MNGTYENIDCMELMATLKDKEIDLAIVDPPYGINISNEIDRSKFKENTSSNSMSKYENSMREKMWDSAIPSDNYFKELFRVSKNQIIFGGNYFVLRPTRCLIVWDKMTYIPTMSQVEFAWTSFKKHSELIKINSNQLDRFHPTQKPVKLYEWLLTNYAKPNDLILDTHCGSASSLIACENLGFKYIASELDKDYYSQSLQRLQAHLAQGKLFQRVGGDQIQLSQPSMFA